MESQKACHEDYCQREIQRSMFERLRTAAKVEDGMVSAVHVMHFPTSKVIKLGMWENCAPSDIAQQIASMCRRYAVAVSEATGDGAERPILVKCVLYSGSSWSREQVTLGLLSQQHPSAICRDLFSRKTKPVPRRFEGRSSYHVWKESRKL